jgi:hypothetical protein
MPTPNSPQKFPAAILQIISPFRRTLFPYAFNEAGSAVRRAPIPETGRPPLTRLLSNFCEQLYAFSDIYAATHRVKQ